MTTPAKATKPAHQARNPPNQTLYVNNLNDKISKEDLRRALYTLFSTYGHVLDVVALKTMKCRGQAFIVFRDAETSSQAMRALQGFEMFGKEIRIGYAKGKSNIISRLDGTAKVPEAAKPDAPAANPTQKSVFGAPPGQTIAVPPSAALKIPNGVPENGAKSPQGTKRPREEDGSSDDDTPMDVDMDESDEADESEEE